MLSCDKPGCDMAWVAPRAHMARLMGQAVLHRDCADTGLPPHGASRVRNVRDIASCCSTSEWLLWYTQSARAQPGQPAIPVHRSSDLEPDRGAFTVLREASHACTRALSPHYASAAYALSLQQKHGLSTATGGRLRRLFGQGNVSSCRQALEPWNLPTPRRSVVG